MSFLIRTANTGDNNYTDTFIIDGTPYTDVCLSVGNFDRICVSVNPSDGGGGQLSFAGANVIEAVTDPDTGFISVSAPDAFPVAGYAPSAPNTPTVTTLQNPGDAVVILCDFAYLLINFNAANSINVHGRRFGVFTQ